MLEDNDAVVMVEDVTTSGKSVDETYPLITGAANIEVKALWSRSTAWRLEKAA